MLTDELLHNLTALIGAPDDGRDRCEVVAERLAGDTVSCAVRLFEHGRLVTLAAAGSEPSAVMTAEPDELLVRLRAGELIRLQDLAYDADDDAVWAAFLSAAGLHAALLVPLEADGEFAGVIGLFSADPEPWSEVDDDRCRLLAGVLGKVLFGPSELAEKSFDEAGASRYRDCVAGLHANRDPDEACRRALETVQALLSPDWAVLARYDADDQRFECHLFSDVLLFRAEEVPDLATALESSEMLVNPPDWGSEDRLRQLRVEAGVTCHLVMPLRFQGERLGVFEVGYREAGSLSSKARATFDRFGFHVSLALRDALLRQTQEEAVSRLHHAQYEATQGAKFRALAQMAGGVAHEFNNALGGILARAQILQRQTQDRRILKGLTTIAEIGWRAAETVRRLQEFTRERSEEDFAPTPVTEIWDRLRTSARDKLQEFSKGSAHKYHIETEHGTLEGVVLANAEELAEAVGNVIVNALEATPGGGVVMVHAHTDGMLLHIDVVDRGRGMTPEEQQSCFDPFFSTKAETGVGLGLSVTYGIVSRHRGEIEIESTPENGTTVNVTLPLTASRHERPAAAPHLLVIDDESALCEVLAELFQGVGYTVDTCAGGREGIERFSADHYDLVCTDLRTEDLSGWEVIRAVKTSGRGTPVVLLTGFREQLKPDQIEESGVDAVLGKPFTLQQVLDTAQKLLDGR